jgi:Tfp pilus assembly protein PilF
MTPGCFARLATGVVAGGLLIIPAYAQKPPATGSTGAGAGAGSTTGTTGTRAPTTTPTNPTTGTPSNSTSPTISAPVFLSGHVAIDDGSPLPGPVTIERVCNGVTHAEGYTDTKGNFGIQLGNEQGVFQDATDGSGGGSGATGLPGMAGGSLGMSGGNTGMGQSSSERLLNNCELRARLGGYRSQSIILAGRRAMDNPDVGTILLHRESPGEASTVSITTLQAPKDARKAYEKGLEFIKKNKYADARTQYEKAVQIDQKFAAAWCELGKMQAGAQDFDMARGSFRMAIQSDPKFPVPYVELAIIAVEQKKWQEVSDLTATVIKLDPFDYPQAFLFNAAAHYSMRETEAAEKSVKEAERLDSRHQYPQIAHLYGLILAQKQDYEGAVTHLRDYLRLYPGASDAGDVRTQLQKLDQVVAQK